MRNLVFTLALTLGLPLAAQADADAPLNRTDILREADSCDMKGQQEITFLTATPFSEIYARLPQNRQLITQSLQRRYACYQDVIKLLEAYLTTRQQMLSQHPLDVPALEQWQIDTGLRDTFILRQTISQELLLNILRDLEYTPADAAFMLESAKTKTLLRQDFSTLLNHTGRQLAFDEQQLRQPHTTASDVLKIKLALAAHQLSQAQLAYEDEGAPPALATARLATLLSSVPGHIYEIIAFDATQTTPQGKLSKKTITTLASLVHQAEATLEKIPQMSTEALYEQISSLQDALLQTQQEAQP